MKTALISVSDKEGIVDFAKELISLGFKIISTGGTYNLLLDQGIDVIKVEDYTKFPEILDGRVKTLHPNIHAGILAKRNSIKHVNTLNKFKIKSIDLVCVNLYPFALSVRKNSSFKEAIENIDIGGPAMIRASGKNWENVTIITDKSDYKNIIIELKKFKNISNKTKFYLAKKAFSHTALYDGLISNYLTSISDDFVDGLRYENKVPKLNIFPQIYNKQFNKLQDLRYGENPHQKAAFYMDSTIDNSNFVKIQGKELSYNNIVDMDCAWECAQSFNKIVCVIVKHATPCAVSLGKDTLNAYKLAFESDKMSSFGGIIAFNTLVDSITMKYIINGCFIEVLIAPDFSVEALKIAANKPNIRIIKVLSKSYNKDFDIKRVSDGGLLLQTYDNNLITSDKLTIVSKNKPTQAQIKDLLFLFQVVKFVKSNAIVFGKNGITYGIGAGQMSRVESILIAIRKAKQANLNLEGACCASDAFFPFRDGVDIIAKSGIKAIIHPGGSIKDPEVIASANENSLVMVTTNVRYFRH